MLLGVRAPCLPPLALPMASHNPQSPGAQPFPKDPGAAPQRPSQEGPRPDPGAPSDPEDGGPRMSLGDHLDELRRRLVMGFLGVAVAFALAWGFKDWTTATIMRPLHQAVGWLNEDLSQRYERRLAADPSLDRELFFLVDRAGNERLRMPIDARPQATGPAEAFLVELKAALYLALFVGGPLLLWQLWQFIAAGLYAQERRAVLSYIPASMVLFFAGTLFGYFLMVPYAMYFLNASVDLTQVRPDFRIAQYFTFLSTLCLGLGVVFQLPVLMTALARVGLVEARNFSRYRGHFIVCAFVIGALLTPPDPFTQSLMAGPMILLYEVGILLAKLGERRAKRAAAPAGSAAGAAT